MKNYYESRRSSFWTSLCVAVVGLVLMIFPAMSSVVFTKGLAVFVLLYALLHAWRWRKAAKASEEDRGALVSAIIFLIFSLIAFFMPEVILSFLPFVSGILLILDGLVKLPWMKAFWECGGQVRTAAVISVILPLAAGIFLAFFPFEAAAMLIRCFGIFLFIDGILDLIRNMLIKKYSE